MVQKKHLCWIICVEILFLLVNLVVEGNYLIGLQLFSNTAGNHEDQEKYSLGSYLFDSQIIKFHVIILAILVDILLFLASFCQIRLLVKKPQHIFIHRIQVTNMILISIRIILGIGEHIQESASFDKNSVQLACNQSTAGQTNQGCNLLLGRTLLLAFIYISEFFVLASIISFRYYYTIYLRQPTTQNSQLVIDLLHQEQQSQHQINELEQNAAQISVELSEKQGYQPNQNSIPSFRNISNSIRQQQMYLTNRVLQVETRHISSTQSSALQKQLSLSGGNNLSPIETLSASLQHSPLTKGHRNLKRIKKRDTMPSLLTNPVFTEGAKTSFASSLQIGQKPFALSLQSTRNQQITNLNASDSSSNTSQPESPSLELGLKRGASEIISEESEDEDPRIPPNSTFRTETNKQIHPLSIVPSAVIAGNGIAKASTSILANAISTSLGTSVGQGAVEVAASPFRAIFSKVLNSFLDKK